VESVRAGGAAAGYRLTGIRRNHAAIDRGVIMDSLALQGALQLAFGAMAPFVLQWLKNAKWFPFLNQWSARWWKVLVSGIVALCTALGLSYSFDPVVGRLIIDGLTWTNVAHSLLAFALSFGAQQAMYSGVIKPLAGGGPANPARFVPVVLLAVGLSASTLGCGGYNIKTEPVAAIGNAGDQIIQINGRIERALMAAGAVNPALKVNPILRDCRKVDAAGLELADLLDQIDALPANDPQHPKLVAAALVILERLIANYGLIHAPPGSTVALIQQIGDIVAEGTKLVGNVKAAFTGGIQ
jgi:hypothetical protein